MSSDPLDVFNNLDSKIGRHMKEEKDFPGNTAPRNRGVVTPIRIEHDWLKQLRSSEYQVNGVTKRFYTVGELGRALKRKAVTISPSGCSVTPMRTASGRMYLLNWAST